MIGISDNKVILFDRIYRTNATEVHKKFRSILPIQLKEGKKEIIRKTKTLFEPKNQPKTNLVPKKAGRPKVSGVKCFERTKLIIDTESAKLGLSELHFIEKILSFYLDSLSFVQMEPVTLEEQKIPKFKLKLLEPTKN